MYKKTAGSFIWVRKLSLVPHFELNTSLTKSPGMWYFLIMSSQTSLKNAGKCSPKHTMSHPSTLLWERHKQHVITGTLKHKCHPTVHHSKCTPTPSTRHSGSVAAILLLFRRFQVKVLAGSTMFCLTTFTAFLSTSNYITTISFHIFSSSLFTVHPFIQCYTFWATNNRNKDPTNKH
jgi:hypothetical protein